MTELKYQHIKTEVYHTAIKLCEAGLLRLSAGNVSARHEDGNIAITPSGMLYSEMSPEDITIIDRDGEIVDGRLKPSSETPMHLALYESLPQVGAIAHTHSPYIMAFAATGTEIPVVCLELMSVGGPLPVAPFASPGSREAGIITRDYFTSQPQLKALILRNHGLVAIGSDLEQAIRVATDCEVGAQVYQLALQSGVAPVPLDPEQISRIRARYQKTETV